MKYAIEGTIDGQWGREPVGDVDDSTLFDTYSEAEVGLHELVNRLGFKREQLRIIEVDAPGKFVRFAGNQWLGGKAVALHESREPGYFWARVETSGGKLLGQRALPKERFDAPLSASAHAELIEELTAGRVKFDWEPEAT